MSSLRYVTAYFGVVHPGRNTRYRLKPSLLEYFGSGGTINLFLLIRVRYSVRRVQGGLHTRMCNQ